MTNQFTDEQVEAAAKVLAPDGVFAEDFGEYFRKRDNYRREEQAEEQRYYMRKARAALVAAAGVAPVVQQVSESDLAEVIRRSYENEQGLKIRDDKRTARAVAEWLRGESR